MSHYIGNKNLYSTTIGHTIPNGFATQIDEKLKNKMVFLDVTPVRTPNFKSLNTIVPIRNNLIETQISKDIVYENLKPVFVLLRLMGILPLSRPSSGVNQFQVTSFSMLYSALFYFSLVSYVLYLSLHKVQILRTAERKFEEAVIEYLFTVYLFPMIVVPMMWYETRKIAEVLNGWVEFEIQGMLINNDINDDIWFLPGLEKRQAHNSQLYLLLTPTQSVTHYPSWESRVVYKKLSGQALPLRLQKKSLAIAVIIPVLSTTSVVITHVTMVDFKLVQTIPYVFLEILTYILGGYWYLLCETLSICAIILADDFQQALRHIGPAGNVAEYRALWLRLSKLARDTGIANCYTFTFVNLYLFLIITLSIYGLLSQISEGFGIKDIGLAVTATCSIFLLFFICDEAHYASQNVRTNFQKKLLMVELSWMNTDAQTEVNMFLRATEMNPSQISLGGFFDVNRNLFKSLLATMVTYLVVLLQFQISIPDEAPGEMQFEERTYVNETTVALEATTLSTMTTILTTLAKKKKKQ